MSNHNTKTANSSTNRKRGIAASRVKLEQAMLQAGFKTQTVVALTIAENEGLDLDNPPKDMVNRVFREIPVDPHTLERVANALNVSAYSLMLSTNDIQEKEKVELSNEPVSNKPRKTLVYSFGSIFIALLIAFFYFDISTKLFQEPITNVANEKIISIALIDIGNVNIPEIDQLLATKLGNQFNLQTIDTALTS